MSTPALESDPLLDVADIAAHQGVTISAINKRIQRGTAPPFHRTGGRRVIRQSAYLAWLDEQAKAQA